MKEHIYDYVIIGSGFGGSVSALRLSEKGYKVLVIEKGKWFTANDFPKNNMQLRKWLWLPSIRFFGIFKLTFLKHIGILSGVGVGGGSLVYANTLPMPKATFFTSGSWGTLKNWQETLAPFYIEAKRMLGVAQNPFLGDADLALEQLSADIGRGEYFEPADVAIYFGKADETVPDPYFGGKGPSRTGCTFCGACMTGCRYNAKNTLDKNYLYLAQQLGCEIIAEKEVFGVKPVAVHGEDAYEISYQKSTGYFKKKHKVRAKGVIFSGGVLGTVKLLHKLKKTTLPKLSGLIGRDIRTNNESLLGILSLNKKNDYSKGIAIGSMVHTDEDSHLEPVRYGKGSVFWRFLMLPMTKGNNFFSRFASLFGAFVKSPVRHLKIITMHNFSARSPILLFMQHLDSTIEFKPGWFGLKSVLQNGPAPTADNETARKLALKYAKLVDGEPYVTPTESLLGIPTTAHILGGAVMGETINEGVIDSENRLFGYKNMFVCDGSMISANPGVNPSLTITAITEYAMNLIPKKKKP